MVVLSPLWHALTLAFGMGWIILWPLILGFVLSAAIQAVVSRQQMSRLLPDDRPRSLAIAAALGAASSSCSYAAVALARSLVKKGANFTAAMAFEIASTNLVIEIGIIMAVLLGWQFTLAEFIGGPLMIILLALLFRRFLTPRLLAAATAQAQRDVPGKMEGHAHMHHMSVEAGGSLWQRLRSRQGITATSHFYVMDWASVWTDIVIGLLLAGAIAAWVPESFFEKLFLTDHALLSALWGPLIGPLIAVMSFVCSVGNIPLAAVLWNGGISFGGAISFVFADLIVLPILRIYKKYYGAKMSAFLLVTFYAAMAGAGYLVEIIFWLLGITPDSHHARAIETSPGLNYTTGLNLIFLAVSAGLVWRFWRSGGQRMLKMMR